MDKKLKKIKVVMSIKCKYLPQKETKYFEKMLMII